MRIIDKISLEDLFAALKRRGFLVVGPTLRDGAIVYDQLNSPLDLPVGWTDEQEAGTYRIRPRSDKALFGYNVGPHSWKRFLFPSMLKLWSARKDSDGTLVACEPTEPVPPKYAFLGVRACELKAITIQDTVFLKGAYVDSYYKALRERICIVAVNCGQAGGTCFCSSMQTGPKVQGGYDLCLTEIIDAQRHQFLVETGSTAGTEILGELQSEQASTEEIARAQEIVASAAASMGRSLDTNGIKSLLYRNLESSSWDEVATRCLSCANCTMVCPTCFCSSVEDTSDLSGEKAERTRRWDSCFTLDSSYVHGGSIRSSTRARYRQWLTHKLATWIDQFGTSGCVGCGRCISWCPVGIDLTAEVAKIRAADCSAPIKEAAHI